MRWRERRPGRIKSASVSSVRGGMSAGAAIVSVFVSVVTPPKELGDGNKLVVTGI